jgi:dihydrolipoamide dehydrogenase
MLPHLLPNEDEEIGRLLERVLEKGGIKIITSAKVTEIGDGEMKERKVTVLTEKGKETIYAEKILVAAGRAPNIEGLGLEEIGVAFDRKGIKVNDKMETNIPGVYAIGDVVGKFLLAHVASQEGIVAAENALGGDSRINYKAIPRCIFTIPEVAFTGLSEKQAVEEGFKVKVGRFPFSASGRALTMDEAEGLVKVVADAGTGEILGVHIIGPSATDLIAECVLAINLEATISEIEDTIHAHPTLSEALKEAVLDVDGKAIHIGKKKL